MLGFWSQYRLPESGTEMVRNSVLLTNAESKGFSLFYVHGAHGSVMFGSMK